jgi:molybdopterin/thiamine biosynthesis adenylyltransferase
MHDQQLLRYSRHILLDEIGIEGQQRVLDAHALVIGAGGLGSPAALYLAASGIGRITLVDDDTVDLTNLQRQVMHTTARVGQPVVLDCSDNFATRHAVNRACVAARVPLVAGAVIRFDGQMSVYDMRDPASPCYACLFPEDSRFEDVACSTMGVFAPLVGVVGAVQAAEALKLVVGIKPSLAGRLQMLDGRAMEWSEVRVARNPACPVCAGKR